MSKFALITGGGSGVGLATAKALAGAGWTLALTGRRQEALEAALAVLPGEGHMIHAADITEEAAVEGLFVAVAEAFGRLDLLFNNAGRNAPAVDIDELSVADWKGVIDANLTGSFLCARAAFALMKRQDPKGGRIVNNGSISAHAPRPFSAPYTASKHAITGLTRALSLDGRRHDIAVGQVDIGNAASEMTERMTGGVPQADGSLKPEPRMAAEDVGRTVLHMAELPLSANIQFVTVMATKMPFIGRG